MSISHDLRVILSKIFTLYNEISMLILELKRMNQPFFLNLLVQPKCDNSRTTMFGEFCEFVFQFLSYHILAELAILDRMADSCVLNYQH